MAPRSGSKPTFLALSNLYCSKLPQIYMQHGCCIMAAYTLHRWQHGRCIDSSMGAATNGSVHAAFSTDS